MARITPEQYLQLTGQQTLGATPPALPKKRSNIFLGPLAGSSLGFLGLLAGPAAPVAVPALAALGSGLGAYGERKLKGEETTAKELATEAAFGAAPGVLRLAGKGVKALRGARAVAPTLELSSQTRPTAAARAMSQGFPMGAVGRRDLVPNQVFQEVIDLGVPPVKTATGWQQIVDTVTGGSGLLPKVVREGLAKTKGAVDIGDVQTISRNLLNQSDVLTDVQIKDIQNIISRSIGPTLGKKSALDAFDVARSLERKAADALKLGAKNTESAPFHAERGRIYRAVADEINERIAGAVGRDPSLLASLKRPEVITTLAKKVSPEVARRFANATSIQDIRSLQKPFVRVGKIIEESERAGETVFSGMGQNMAGQLIAAGGLGAAGSQVGEGNPLYTAAGIGLGLLTGPMAATLVRQALPATMGASSKILQAGGKGGQMAYRAATSPVTQQVAGQQALRTAFGEPEKAMAGGLPASPEGLLTQSAPAAPQILGRPVSADKVNRINTLFQQAMLADLAQGGKNLEQLQMMQKVLTGQGTEEAKPLSDTAIGRINDYNTAIGELSNLSERIGQNVGVDIGPRRFNLPGTATSTVQADIDRVRQIVGKAMEGGVLRKEDEEKYKRILPNPGDSVEVAQAKIQSVLQALQNQLANYQTLQSQYGSRTAPGNTLPASPADVQF